MHFTPIAPLDLQGTIPNALLELSEEVCLKSAQLTGAHATCTLEAIKDLSNEISEIKKKLNM